MSRPYEFAGNFRVDFVLDENPPSDQRSAATDRTGRLAVGSRVVKHPPFAVPFAGAPKNGCAGRVGFVSRGEYEGVLARRVHSIIPPSRSRLAVGAMVEITG